MASGRTFLRISHGTRTETFTGMHPRKAGMDPRKAGMDMARVTAGKRQGHRNQRIASTYQGPRRTFIPTMNSKTDLLTYHKEVLEKISRADVRTFRKELRKAFKRLVPEDREALKLWFRNSCVCRVETPQATTSAEGA